MRLGTRGIVVLAALLLTPLVTLGQSLDRRIENLITQSDLAGALVGVAVYDPQRNQIIAGSNARTSMIPASNMKLLTSGAALLTLGDDFAFRTKFLVQEEGERRTLIIVGDGDPALGDPELLGRGTTPLDVSGLLDRVAGALAKKGVDWLDEIVLDGRVFETTSLHPSWPRDQLNRWYCAEIAGLNFHTNTVSVFPRAMSAGSVPRVTLEPKVPWLEVQNRAQSVARGSNTVWVSRPDESNMLTIFGNVRSRAEISVALANPVRYTGRVFASALAARGITVGPPGTSPADAIRLAGEGERFEGAQTVAIVRTSIADVLNRCNTDSHNLYAEALLKRTAHAVTGDPGSWENGAAVMRMLLRDKLGSGAAVDVAVSDGSGMSRDNRVSPEVLAKWVGELYEDDSVRDALLASLPGPGEGTLRSRFTETPLTNRLEAKSGYLTGVYALSGLVIDDAGRAISFSILLNDVQSGKPSRGAKPLHEAIVREVDAWLSAQSVSALGG